MNFFVFLKGQRDVEKRSLQSIWLKIVNQWLTLLLKSVYQPIFDTIKSENVKFVEGTEASQLTPEQMAGCLVVLDDQQQLLSEKYLTNLFCIWSHHYSASVIFIIQHLFLKKACMRTLSVNSHYNILFTSPKDLVSVRVLNR